MQTHLDAENVVGVSESLPGLPWYILYTRSDDLHRISAALGSSLMKGATSRDSPTPVLPFNAIPTEYMSNLRKCYIQDDKSGTQDSIGNFRRIWAQTLSSELIFVEDGALQWSVPLDQTVQRL